MANTNREKHQDALKQSGYRVPDHFYVEQVPADQSAEEESGDGGKAALSAEPKTGKGYQGKLMSAEEYQKKAKAGPAENKADKK